MSIYGDFIGTVQAGGLTNPYGLAAVAATGKHESGYSARNAYGAWSDPSERGAPGTAGGILSWRGTRFARMSGAPRLADAGGYDPALASDAEEGAAGIPSLPGRMTAAPRVGGGTVSIPGGSLATEGGINRMHEWGQGLYAKADEIRRAGAVAETPEQQRAVQYALDGVNSQIERYETWAERQGKAPNLETVFTPEGGEQKGYFRNGEWVPVGGAKAPKGGSGPGGEMTATDKKAIFSAEDDAVILDSTIDSLNRALELNDKAYEGWTAGTRADVGYNLGAAGEYLGFDQDAAKATREYQNIMTGEAAAAMSETLKGATTDRELGIFMGIIGDLNTAPETRKRTIEKLLTLAQRKRATLQRRADELRGGTYYQPGGGSSGSSGGGSAAPAGGASGRTSSGLSWSAN